MGTESIPDLVRGYFAAYQRGDRAWVAARLAPGFTFTSPYDDHIDTATYFERCWPDQPWVREFRFEKIVADGDDAFVLYEAVPMEGESFRNTEHMRFENGRLRAVEVYFGALPKAGDAA